MSFISSTKKNYKANMFWNFYIKPHTQQLMTFMLMFPFHSWKGEAQREFFKKLYIVNKWLSHIYLYYIYYASLSRSSNLLRQLCFWDIKNYVKQSCHFFNVAKIQYLPSKDCLKVSEKAPTVYVMTMFSQS